MNTSRGSARRFLQTLCLAGAVLPVLSACVSSKAPPSPAKQKEAAGYNVQLGLAYMRQGDLALAKDKLDKAVKEDPDNADVHSARGLLFQKMGQNDKADAEFRTALSLKPHDPTILNFYGVFLCQAGRTDDAVKRFEEAANNPLYSTPEAAYTNAGVCLHAAKKNDQARTYFVKALQRRPNFAEAEFQLTSLDFEQHHYAQARASLDLYMSTFNETADLLLLGVRIARAQGDVVGAQRYARRLQQDFPGSDQVRALAELERAPPG